MSYIYGPGLGSHCKEDSRYSFSLIGVLTSPMAARGQGQVNVDRRSTPHTMVVFVAARGKCRGKLVGNSRDLHKLQPGKSLRSHVFVRSCHHAVAQCRACRWMAEESLSTQGRDVCRVRILHGLGAVYVASFPGLPRFFFSDFFGFR